MTQPCEDANCTGTYSHKIGRCGTCGLRPGNKGYSATWTMPNGARTSGTFHPDYRTASAVRAVIEETGGRKITITEL